MKKTFAEEKFRGNLKTSLLTMVITYLLILTDYILIGQTLGEDALAAYAFVVPFISVITFFSYTISSGTAVMIAMELGKGESEEGNHYFQQGVLMTVGVGLLLSFLFFAGRDFLIDVSNIPNELRPFVQQYFVFLSMFPIVQMLNKLLFAVIWNDGGDHYCIVSNIVQFISNLVLSVLLMKKMGIGGAALGALISMLLADLVYVFYFRLERHEFHRGWFCRWGYVINMLCFSLRDSICYLYISIMYFVMNWFLMKHFDSRAVLIFSVLMNLENFYLTVFNSPADSVLVLLSVYFGEKNGKGLIKSMRVARKAAIVEGIFGMLLLLVIADWLPGVFGFTSAYSMEQAAAAIRILALLSLVFPLIMLYSVYYMAIGKIAFSLSTMTMQVLFMPITCSMLLSFPFGLRGVWGGLVIGSLLTFLIDMLFLKYHYKDRTFPLLQNKEELEQQLSYDISASAEGLMSLVDQVEKDLTERGIERKKILRIMLMIEETEMLAIEKNGEKGGIIQCDLFFEDKIRMVLRDSGSYSNVTNKDQEAESFRVYAASMIVGSMKSNRYVGVWGNNRTMYTF